MTIVFGGAALSGDSGGYGFGTGDDPDRLIKHALEQGIDWYDTAPIYGFDRSEILLGKSLQHKREQVKIISKAGGDWHSNRRVNMTNEPKVVLKMLEKSLKNLKSDYIDVYMIHWPDPKVDIRYPLEVLLKAQEQDKILEVGLCNTNPQDLAKAREMASINYLQSEFNLFNDGFENLALAGSKTMGWGTFDKGILAGSVHADRKFEAKDCRAWAPWWKKSGWKEKAVKAQEFKANFKLKHIALQFSLQEMDFSLCGAKTVAQIDELVTFANLSVPSDVLDSARQFFRG